MPPSDCEPLLHDVLISLMTAATLIENARTWLVAAMCNASRAYQRSHARIFAVEGPRLDEMPDLPGTFDADELENELLVRSILERLSPRDREVLRLHYFESLTAPEMAVRLGTTAGYAAKLVSKALGRARAMYAAAAAPRVVASHVNAQPLLPGCRSETDDPIRPPAEVGHRQRPFAAFRVTRGITASAPATVAGIHALFDVEAD